MKADEQRHEWLDETDVEIVAQEILERRKQKVT
jgi:hypothetical protein